MASQYAVNDSMWPEVLAINGYALFMGYLMMGVRGLGVLIFTWTTVVLLGGFVSVLQNKDFWCLTVITLVQTTGVFSILLKEKFSDVVRSWWGLLLTVVATVQSNEFGRGRGRKRAYVVAVFQGLLVCIILFPVGILCLLGLVISVGVSLWRLIEHDFGDAGGDNQKPALRVIYSLAVAQGVLYGYKIIHGFLSEKDLVKFVAHRPGMVDKELVAEYLEETVAGCQKDPSFAIGRNLVTYGMDLMAGATSNEGFLAGVRVLGGAIKDDWPSGRKVQAKHLMTRSDSSNHMIQRLLKIVGPRSPYSTEVRTCAARIVALVAHGIRLDQFSAPGVIECISSVFDPSIDESYRRHDDLIATAINDDQLSKDYPRFWLLQLYEQSYLLYERQGPISPAFCLNSLIQRLVQCLTCKTSENNNEANESQSESTDDGFDELLKEAVNIIQTLLVDEGNRRNMSNIVLQKFAMAPLNLHRDNHDAILETYWVQWLVAAIKDTNSQGQILEEEPAAPSRGGQRRRSNDEMAGYALGTAINSIKHTINSIFDCLDCRATQKKEAIQILLHLSLDMSFLMDTESRTRRLTWMLLVIHLSRYDDHVRHWIFSRFTGHADFYSIRHLAGEKLSDILQMHELSSERYARELQIVDLALGDLISAFAEEAGDISIRTHAAIIMEGLCATYDPYSYVADEVTEIFVRAIPMVVMEILIPCAPTTEERQAHALDVEEDGVSEVTQESRTRQDGYTNNERLRKPLVSMCRDVYMKRDRFESEFKVIASKICEEQGKSFEYFESLLV